MSNSVFPAGVVVFFRLQTPDGMLARSVHPKGRDVRIDRGRDAHPDDYVITDEYDNFLAAFPRDFVAAILPIETTGPGAPDANNPPKPPVD
jgi:hypothetical protein